MEITSESHTILDNATFDSENEFDAAMIEVERLKTEPRTDARPIIVIRV